MPSFVGTLAGCTHPERAPDRRICALLCATSGSTLETRTSFKLAAREPLPSLNKVYEHALARRGCQTVLNTHTYIATCRRNERDRLQKWSCSNLILEPHVSIAPIFAWRNSSGRPLPRAFAAAAFGELKKLRAMHAQTATADNLAVLTAQAPKTPASCGAHSALLARIPHGHVVTGCVWSSLCFYLLVLHPRLSHLCSTLP